MGKYIDESKRLLECVGGRENIAAVTHCVTRMRFVLKDTAKANKEEIEKIKSVKGTFIQAGQFQVIIGNTVTDFYNDFVKVSGVEGTSKEDAKDAAKSNMTFIQRLMANLAEIFSPAAISMIIVPFFALVPSVLIAHTVLGPIGWKIGDMISTVVYSGLTSSFSWLFAGVFGFVYAPLVITGLHHMTNAIDLQLMSQVGGTLLWPMIALSNIAQGSAVLAMIYLQRKNEEEKQVSIPACISAYLGVTEPALFGVNLKYGFPFICGMIGSGIAAVISVASGVMANAIGIGGIPGILSIQPQHMLMFAVAMVVAIVVPFVLTVIVGRKKLS